MTWNKDKLIIVRGAGDISTGTIHRLFRAGFPVLALETDKPSAIRRKVAFSEAVYDWTAQVEGVTAVRVGSLREAEELIGRGELPLLVDPAGESIRACAPAVVIDAILAKKNLGTSMDMAPLTIALGPGFEAGRDVHYVIETMRGHDLGRIIEEGYALPNTGVPGLIGGYGAQRVIHAPAEGVFHMLRDIGSMVKAGEAVGYITPIGAVTGDNKIGSETGETGKADSEGIPVRSQITGLLRGIIRDRYPVTEGFKVADVDPREEEWKNCFTISDKARCIAGSVLELVCRGSFCA